jgi:hypothetical protein
MADQNLFKIQHIVDSQSIILVNVSNNKIVESDLFHLRGLLQLKYLQLSNNTFRNWILLDFI